MSFREYMEDYSSVVRYTARFALDEWKVSAKVDAFFHHYLDENRHFGQFQPQRSSHAVHADRRKTSYAFIY